MGGEAEDVLCLVVGNLSGSSSQVRQSVSPRCLQAGLGHLLEAVQPTVWALSHALSSYGGMWRW